jgi:hypothetical protein
MILDCARARPGAFGALRLWIFGLGAALAAALAGCSTNTNIKNGTPVVTVSSAAAGSFSTYVVGISLYSLTRSDGYIAYPAGYTAEEFADLTKRVDLTELLNAVGIPTGTYTSLTIALDYSAAPGNAAPLIYVTGQSTIATVQNSTGTKNPGVVDVTVKFDPSQPLVVNLNQSARLALQFDLAAFNSISGNTVTVRPFLTATAPPATTTDTKPIRARGLFVAANTGASDFVEDLRPFEDNVYSTVGALQVNTTANTYYNINGTVYTGAAGLAAMTSLTSNTPVVAYGAITDLATITPSLTATEVYAGTVVSNGQFEHVQGIVTARSGNSLTVSGATYLYYQGYCPSNFCFNYYSTGTVNVGASTVVTQDGTVPPSGSTLSSQSISVGSQIDAVGLGSTSSSNALTLDATAGEVRLQSTPVWGTLNSGALGSATLTALSIGPFPASSFNFAGTGTASANDATAGAYVVNTGTIDESATPAGTLLRADGFPTSFGSAPPDFDATAVTLGSAEPANLIVEWSSGSGTTSPFTSDTAGLVLNLANATTAEVVVGPQTTALTGTPTIDIAGATEFAIGNAATGVSTFISSSAFLSALNSTLNGSNKVYRVVAVGTYDASSNTFAAQRVDVPLD